jgi:hypothetical protein
LFVDPSWKDRSDSINQQNDEMRSYLPLLCWHKFPKNLLSIK